MLSDTVRSSPPVTAADEEGLGPPRTVCERPRRGHGPKRLHPLAVDLRLKLGQQILCISDLVAQLNYDLGGPP